MRICLECPRDLLGRLDDGKEDLVSASRCEPQLHRLDHVDDLLVDIAPAKGIFKRFLVGVQGVEHLAKLLGARKEPS